MKRYPGIRPFTAEDQDLFYGREKEMRELSQMVILNDIIVLFGKSGTGKSSLLNAGVCPQFGDRNLHPVFIRLNNTKLNPVHQIYEFLHEHDYIPKDMPAGLTLWEYFKRFWYVDLGEVFMPVIILDQFEELFTLYVAKERQLFINQLADLANGIMPPSLQQKINDSSAGLDKGIDWQKPPKVKFILSIRSDYLYLLNDLSAHIPSILRTRFQLNMLNHSNAIQAITLPAIATGHFESPAFEYEQDSLEEIIEVLGKKESDDLSIDGPDSDVEIEAFQLQLFCQQIENKIIAEKKPAGFKVKPEFFGGKAGIQKMIGDFYNDVVSRVPKEYQVAVETMAATFLIRNNRRIIMEESSIREECGISQNLLDQLHEERLLRKEARTGNFYYEISHDTLIEPVLEKYREIAIRLEKERQEKERLAREQELQAIRQQAEEERQRAEAQMKLREAAEVSAQRARQRTRLAMGAFIIALLLAGTSLWLRSEAVTAQTVAETAKEEAEQNKEMAVEQRIEADTAKAIADREKLKAIAAKDSTKIALEIAEARRIEADNAKAIANIEKLKAIAAKDSTRSALKIAEARRIEADTAKAIANRAKLKAITAKDSIDLVLNDLQLANKETATLLRKEIDKSISLLDYEDAYEKTEAALDLVDKDPESMQRLQEIAFFYTESGQYLKAKEKLSGIGINANADLGSLRDSIKNIDSAHYDFLEKRYYPEMVLVPGGRYKLSKDDQSLAETPIDSFWLAKTETTVYQYNLFAKANKLDLPEKPSSGRNGDDPIMGLSWFDAIAYANWISDQKVYPKSYNIEKKAYEVGDSIDTNILYNKKLDWPKLSNWEGGGFRLPTEIEWEYAVSISTDSSGNYNFSGSNDLLEVGWYQYNSEGRAHPVESKTNNKFGLFDKSVKVWEWCWDWYVEEQNADKDDLKKKKRNELIKPTSRVIRGGSWAHNEKYSKVTYRGKSIPNLRGTNYGFRCARNY